MRLWRPVGRLELELIAASGWRAFPPRLRGQPIFYPVLDRGYAEQIAREWNVHDERSGWCGFVVELDIDDDYVARFAVRVVGGGEHRELWVPAEELSEFNQHVRGRMRVVAAFHGPRFTGDVDPATGLPADVPPP